MKSIIVIGSSISAVVLLILLLSIVFPGLFWDNLILPYLWGPIQTDAGYYSGYSAGYNWFNTLFYGLLLSASLIWIWQILKWLKIEFDFKFTISLIPFITVGSIYRVIEDTGHLSIPTAYLFIAPVIYLFLTMIVIAVLVLNYFLEKYQIKDYGLIPLFILLPLLTLLINAPSTAFLGAVVAGLLAYAFIKNRILVPGVGVMVLGLLTLSNIGDFDFSIFLLIVMLASAFSLLVYQLVKFDKVIILMLFGHFVDGFATAIGIDWYGYLEKHVIPRFLIQVTGTGFVMIAYKLAVIIPVIYIVEKLIKPDVKDQIQLGLLRFAIIVLGLAPGLRDALRIALGT